MRRQRPASLRQDTYTSRCLAHSGVLERLEQQWRVIYQIELALSGEDMGTLCTAVGKLDLDLVRYALSDLRKHLNEAALHDTAHLIAERILDTAMDQPSLKRWKGWLGAAPIWPRLAKENWEDALGRGTDIVLSALEREGIALDKKAKQALLSDMAVLQLNDLLPESLLRDFFPAKDDDTSGDINA